MKRELQVIRLFLSSGLKSNTYLFITEKINGFLNGKARLFQQLMGKGIHTQ